MTTRVQWLTSNSDERIVREKFGLAITNERIQLSRISSLLPAVMLLSCYLLSHAQAADAISPVRQVTRVIDGDTLVLDGDEKVRLIGVDTPETVHPKKPVERFGKEASVFTKRQAEGKKVRLEYDTGTGRKDRYGRTLAYVYLPEGTLLNLEIVRQGYGHAYTRFPFSRMEEFRAAEREAREEGRGLWAEGR